MRFTGHAIGRINAEDWHHDFLPSPAAWFARAGGRDPESGSIRISHQQCRAPYYDSLLGKLIVSGGNRPMRLSASE
jgi:acetyl/propionyl-CoA carboxylase alpha subunit